MGNVITGTDLTIDVGKNYKGKLKIYGKTEQEVVSESKNIFNKNNDINSSTNVADKSTLDTGVRINATAGREYNAEVYVTMKLGDVSDLEGKTIRIKATATPNASNLIPAIGISLYDDTYKTSINNESVTLSAGASGDLELEYIVGNAAHSCTNVAIKLYATNFTTIKEGDYVDYTNLIVTVDNEELTYEPYGIKPSPDNPSPIETVEGNVEIKVKGTVATDYESYEEQTIYFPLAEGQKLMEGSYLADDGIHHKKKQVVFDGSDDETWFLSVSQDINIFYIDLDMPALTGGTNTTTTLCNYYQYDFGYIDDRFYISSDATKLFINDNSFSTVVEFKTWLTENPITVEYELAEEEEIVPYTKEQQEAYNNLQNIYLYEGKNYISITSTLSPDLELKYLKIVDDDTEFYISENGRLVIPEYDINYLIDFSASNIPSMPEAMEAAVRVVGKDGDIPLNTTYEPIPFSIVCYTDDNLTPDEKVREEQKINRFMDSIKNKTKILGFERENKFYDVKYNGLLTTVRFPAHVQFTIPVKSSESYAKDLIKKRIQGNSSENSETIKEVGAVFTIRGPAQTPKISFNNYHMEFDEVLLENTELIIDSNKSTATHVNHTLGVKTNVMKYYNHQFPKVKFGENVLAVNSGIDDASQVEVEWNDLKL